jgi:hypothetical protein
LGPLANDNPQGVDLPTESKAQSLNPPQESSEAQADNSEVEVILATDGATTTSNLDFFNHDLNFVPIFPPSQIPEPARGSGNSTSPSSVQVTTPRKTRSPISFPI